MIATWMLSATLFATLAGITAACADSALRSAGRPTRWSWITALFAGAIWPFIAPQLRQSSVDAGTEKSALVSLPSVQIVPGEQPPLTVPWTQEIDSVLLALWLVTSLTLLVRFVHGWIRLTRLRRESQSAVVDGIPVLVSPSVGPALVGLVRPSVVVPADLLALDASLRRLVLHHEVEHRRAGDPWVVVGATILTTLVPWNLALWWIARRARLAVEVDCDARVLAVEPDVNRYGKLLLLISQRQSVTTLAPTLAAFNSHLEQRISAMLPRSSRWRSAKMATALFAMTVFGLGASMYRIPSGVANGRANISTGVRPDTDKVYFEFQVDKPAVTIPGTSTLRYPPVLRSADVEGDVLAQFIVDTTGKTRPGTFKVLRSSHELFTQAVRDAVSGISFRAAELNGVKVSQLVQQPFTFSLSKDGAPARTGVAADGIVRFPASRAVLDSVRDDTVTMRAKPVLESVQPYFEFQVTEAAQQIPGTGRIAYPPDLRTANVQGEVLAQFVVDVNGRVETGTFRALKSDHGQFTDAVQAALPGMRFRPAELRGARVRQLVQQPFTFSLSP